MHHYIIRAATTGEQTGQRHADLVSAKRAAVRASKSRECAVEVVWCDETGKPKLIEGRAIYGRMGPSAETLSGPYI